MTPSFLEQALQEKQRKDRVKVTTQKPATLVSATAVQQALNASEKPTDGHQIAVSSPTWSASLALTELLYPRGENTVDRAFAMAPHLGQRIGESITDFQHNAHVSLMAQAVVLEQAFNRLMSLSMQLLHEPEDADRYMAMALRCQEQHRKTLISISEIKHPKRTTFIKTAQQFNQLKLEQPQPTPLLEAQPYAEMDTRSQKEAVRVGSHLATLEPIDRPKKRGRKSKSSPEQL